MSSRHRSDGRVVGQSAAGRTPVYINGRFLTRKVTGVERFGREILRELDQQLTAEGSGLGPWTVLVPVGYQPAEVYTTLRFRNVGSLRGHAWEQWDLLRHSRDGLLLSLCNSGPVLHARQLVVLHDAAVFKFPKTFSRAYRWTHKTLGFLLARKATLATVSRFSRDEIAKALHIDGSKIAVIPNAADHLARVLPADDVLSGMGVVQGRYFLFVGSAAANKNLARALPAFSSLGDTGFKFVVVGGGNSAVFRDSNDRPTANVITPGRLSDGEILTLYRNATALVFPSLYEGFGIPPLEAMSQGCAVLAADIPVVREVCRDAALYFDPYDVASIAAQMSSVIQDDKIVDQYRASGLKVANTYSWRSSANLLLQALSTVK